MLRDGHRSRLRERFNRSGFKGFADHEIVELMLTLCIPRCDVKARAKALLNKFGSINAIFNASERELTSVRGIGHATAVGIKIIRSLSMLKLQKSLEEVDVLDDSEKLITLWNARLADKSIEMFEVAYVDSQLHLLKDGILELSCGTGDQVNVYPKKILAAALINGATGIILAHNHPIGDARPSAQDEIVTRKIKYAADCLNIKLIDHIIISKTDSFSFREHGLVF